MKQIWMYILPKILTWCLTRILQYYDMLPIISAISTKHSLGETKNRNFKDNLIITQYREDLLKTIKYKQIIK